MKRMKLGLLLVLLIGLAGCSSDSNSSSTITSLEKTVESLKTENSKLRSGQGVQESHSESSKTQSSDDKKTSVKGINEESIYKSNGKEALSIKVTEATTNQSAFPEHMLSLDDYDTQNMVAVKFEFKNISLSDDYGMNGAELIAYDATGKSYEMVNQQDGQDYVGEGRSSTSQFYWEVPNATNINEIEIDYKPLSNADSPKTTFKIPVSH